MAKTRIVKFLGLIWVSATSMSIELDSSCWRRVLMLPLNFDLDFDLLSTAIFPLPVVLSIRIFSTLSVSSVVVVVVVVVDDDDDDDDDDADDDIKDFRLSRMGSLDIKQIPFAWYSIDGIDSVAKDDDDRYCDDDVVEQSSLQVTGV